MNSSTPTRNARETIPSSERVIEHPLFALSLDSGLSVSAAALSVARDSLRVLSAFAWSKEGRLSKNKSAQLCDLMNAWN